MSYDSQGQLVWASDGTRAWVATQASGRTLSKGDLGTGLLWWAALAPIWVGLLQAASPGLAVFLLLPFALLMMDRENVKKASVDISGTLPWVFIFPSVYLYMRYKHTEQPFGAFFVSCPLYFLSYLMALTTLSRLMSA